MPESRSSFVVLVSVLMFLRPIPSQVFYSSSWSGTDSVSSLIPHSSPDLQPCLCCVCVSGGFTPPLLYLTTCRSCQPARPGRWPPPRLPGTDTLTSSPPHLHSPSQGLRVRLPLTPGRPLAARGGPVQHLGQHPRQGEGAPGVLPADQGQHGREDQRARALRPATGDWDGCEGRDSSRTVRLSGGNYVAFSCFVSCHDHPNV